jgi:hypothetical protein
LSETLNNNNIETVSTNNVDVFKDASDRTNETSNDEKLVENEELAWEVSDGVVVAEATKK